MISFSLCLKCLKVVKLTFSSNEELMQNIFLCWQLLQNQYCIPASSATSERFFSSSGNVISDRGTRLNPDNVHTIVYLQSNMHLVKLTKNVILAADKEAEQAKKDASSSHSSQNPDF